MNVVSVKKCHLQCKKRTAKTFLCPSCSRSKLYSENLLKENLIKNKPIRRIKSADGKMIKYWNNYLKNASLKLSARLIHILILLDEVCSLSFFFYYIVCIKKFFSGMNLFTSVFIFHWHLYLNTPSFWYSYQNLVWFWQNLMLYLPPIS